MNEQKLQALFAANPQETPEAFHRAMTQTLDGIVAQERIEQARARSERPAHALRLTRRTLVLAALIALLVATAAVAAYRWQVFDQLWPFFDSGTPKNASQVMQSNLHQETVNNVEITVKEGGYDGRTLYLLYSYRMLDVDVPLSTLDSGNGGIDNVPAEAFEKLEEHGVGWWTDHLWFDGKAIDMPGNSSAAYSVTSAPGEFEVYESWRLDNVDLFLEGEVEISLPIGRKPQQRPNMRDNPEQFDENGNMKLPEDGVVTFKMNVDASRDQVVTVHPNVETVTPEVTAKVTEAAFSPLLTYITLGLEVNPDAMAAYIAENGDGYYNDEGQLLFPYDGLDVFSDYLFSLSLVDGEGKELFPDHYGNNGMGSRWAEYIYPYIENMPDELWLAPVDGGQADMTYAIRVK